MLVGTYFLTNWIFGGDLTSSPFSRSRLRDFSSGGDEYYTSETT